MIKIKDESVILSLDSGQKFDLPFCGGDNCQCDECRITETEKQFLLHKVPVDLTPDNVQIIDERIHISWPDSHQSVIDTPRLSMQVIKDILSMSHGLKILFLINMIGKFLEDKKYTADIKNFVKHGVIILIMHQQTVFLELLSKDLVQFMRPYLKEFIMFLLQVVFIMLHIPQALPHMLTASYKYQPAFKLYIYL